MSPPSYQLYLGCGMAAWVVLVIIAIAIACYITDDEPVPIKAIVIIAMAVGAFLLVGCATSLLYDAAWTDYTRNLHR